jgi:hypothetical protein
MEGYLLDASVIYPLLDYIDKVDVTTEDDEACWKQILR